MFLALQRLSQSQGYGTTGGRSVGQSVSLGVKPLQCLMTRHDRVRFYWTSVGWRLL